MKDFILEGIVIGVFASLTTTITNVIFGTIVGLIKRNANRKAIEALQSFNDAFSHNPFYTNNSDEEDEEKDYED